MKNNHRFLQQHFFLLKVKVTVLNPRNGLIRTPKIILHFYNKNYSYLNKKYIAYMYI